MFVIFDGNSCGVTGVWLCDAWEAAGSQRRRSMAHSDRTDVPINVSHWRFFVCCHCNKSWFKSRKDSWKEKQQSIDVPLDSRINPSFFLDIQKLPVHTIKLTKSVFNLCRAIAGTVVALLLHCEEDIMCIWQNSPLGGGSKSRHRRIPFIQFWTQQSWRKAKHALVPVV